MGGAYSAAIASLKTFAVQLGLVCLAGMSQAEPVSIAGLVVPNTATGAPFVLQSGRDGRNLAALTDPRGLVRINEWAILQTETTGTTAQGLPVLEVVDVLQEHWEQPANFGHYFKGFGTWSGFGKSFRAENYAGVPYEDRRAYYEDNAILPIADWMTSGPTHPPVVLVPRLGREGMALTWNVQAGVHYEVLGSRTVDTGYTLVSNVTAAVTGPTSITVSPDGPHKFFKIRY